MTTKVTMPQLGESVVEGTVGKWLVSEGERVKKDQPIVEIMTDKADSEVPAPVAGVVVKVHVSEDDTVSVGETLCEIDENAEAAAGDRSSAAAVEGNRAVEGSRAVEGNGRGNGSKDATAPAEARAGGTTEAAASPSVRKLAREQNVDLSALSGSGQGGRITRDDVMAAARATGAAAVREAVPPPAAAPAPKPTREGKAEVKEDRGARGPGGAFQVPPYKPRPGDEVVPFSRRRRIIADHMVYSKQTSPDVVTLAEVDLHATSRLRDQHKDQAKKEGIGLSFLAFVAAATCRALREFPKINARVLEDAYVLLRDVNLGIAVDTGEGLVVPVIPNADELTVRGLARSIDELAVRARDGKLKPDDLANKTFTVSNPGRRGNLVGGAIISQPNVAILRMGTIQKRVVVVEKDGEDLMAIRPIMHMALTYDHRVVDGVEANGFLYRIGEILSEADFVI